MFFILSKTLYYLVLPVTIIAVGLIGTLMIKNSKLKRRLLIITCILFYIFTNNFLGNLLLKKWEMQPVPFSEISRQYKYGVVLTGVMQNEQEPKDRPYFNKGADRVFHTYQLYKKGIISTILISGGVGRLIDVEYREAKTMQKAFLIIGVPPEDIILETNARNTAESAIEVAKILKKEDAVNDFILITSAFHMRRAIGTFKAQLNTGISFFPVDVYSDTRTTFEDFIPTLKGLTKWEKLIQEVTGYLAYDLAGHI